MILCWVHAIAFPSTLNYIIQEPFYDSFHIESIPFLLFLFTISQRKTFKEALVLKDTSGTCTV